MKKSLVISLKNFLKYLHKTTKIAFYLLFCLIFRFLFVVIAIEISKRSNVLCIVCRFLADWLLLTPKIKDQKYPKVEEKQVFEKKDEKSRKNKNLTFVPYRFFLYTNEPSFYQFPGT